MHENLEGNIFSAYKQNRINRPHSTRFCGAMAARSAVNRKVGGSSPPRSVKFFATFLLDFVLGLPVYYFASRQIEDEYLEEFTYLVFKHAVKIQCIGCSSSFKTKFAFESNLEWFSNKMQIPSKIYHQSIIIDESCRCSSYFQLFSYLSEMVSLCGMMPYYATIRHKITCKRIWRAIKMFKFIKM